MTRFRYWMADLISGGAVMRRGIYLQDCISLLHQWDARCDMLEAALARIAAEVKPTSNATVRRMGRIAEEALK